MSLIGKTKLLQFPLHRTGIRNQEWKRYEIGRTCLHNGDRSKVKGIGIDQNERLHTDSRDRVRQYTLKTIDPNNDPMCPQTLRGKLDLKVRNRICFRVTKLDRLIPIRR